MAWIKTMDLKVSKKKKVVGRMEISAEEQGTCGWKKAVDVQGEFRETLGYWCVACDRANTEKQVNVLR